MTGRKGGEKLADSDESPNPEVDSLSKVDDLEKYSTVREAMYKKAKEFDVKIHDFETGIRRPYFHVKPLDDLQFGNRHQYIEFIEKVNDFDRVCFPHKFIYHVLSGNSWLKIKKLCCHSNVSLFMFYRK